MSGPSRKVLLALILAVAVTLVVGAGNLAWREVRDPSTCPDLAGVPACWLVLGCAVLAAGSRLLRGSARDWTFWLGALPAFSLALFASVAQALGSVECPKLSNGPPMCYLSLILFGSLIVLHQALKPRPSAGAARP